MFLAHLWPSLWVCFLECTCARPNRASRCPLAAVGSEVQMCSDIPTATGHLSHHRVKLPLLLPQILNDSAATVRSSVLLRGGIFRRGSFGGFSPVNSHQFGRPFCWCAPNRRNRGEGAGKCGGVRRYALQKLCRCQLCLCTA